MGVESFGEFFYGGISIWRKDCPAIDSFGAYGFKTIFRYNDR